MSAITCEWGLEKQQDTNGAKAQNSLGDLEKSICAALNAKKNNQTTSG